ncbi:MAG: hypothetical protein ACE5HA_11170 [Anaerolineae bacterium]
MTVLALLHNLIRWLVLAAGAAAIIRAARGWAGDLDFSRPDNLLGSVYTGLVDLNVVFGVALLVLAWSDPDRPALLHPIMTILAAVVAHAARLTARDRDAKTRHLFQGLGFLLSLGLIVVGVGLVR